LAQTRISLLIELLKTFTDKEFTAFLKFVDSEYFNEDKKLFFLLKKIKRYALKAEKFTSELQLKVYEDTYSEKPLKQKELTKKQYVFLNNRLHKLLRLAEKFLTIENLNADEILKPELLYPSLIDRKQHKLYQRHLKTDTTKLNSESRRGLNYYKSHHKLQIVIVTDLIKNGQIAKEDNYDKLHYYLDVKYIIEKLEYFLAQLSMKKTYSNKNYEFSSIAEISKLLENPQYAKNPLIQTYLSNIKLVEIQSDKSFNELLENLTVNQNIIPQRFLGVFYNNLANYCSIQIRKGIIAYYRKLFDIYNIMHENKLLIVDNFINPNLIKNMITVSCTIKEFEWANNIIYYYKQFIPLKIRESLYSYNKGVINFNEQNYASAQEWFLKVDKISDTYEIGLRIYMLQCIFEIEQDYSDATKQSLESTKQFFKRNAQLASINKKSYLNFITTFIDLYKFKHKATKLKLTKIKNKINNMEVVYKKKWLLDKIEELK